MHFFFNAIREILSGWTPLWAGWRAEISHYNLKFKFSVKNPPPKNFHSVFLFDYLHFTFEPLSSHLLTFHDTLVISRYSSIFTILLVRAKPRMCYKNWKSDWQEGKFFQWPLRLLQVKVPMAQKAFFPLAAIQMVNCLHLYSVLLHYYKTSKLFTQASHLSIWLLQFKVLPIFRVFSLWSQQQIRTEWNQDSVAPRQKMLSCQFTCYNVLIV